MEPVLSVKHVTKWVGNFHIKDMNFNMEPGYVVGLLGRSGAGKTTLINLLLGIYEPDEGDIYIAGYNLKTEPIKAKNQMAFILTDCPFPLELSVLSNAKLFGKMYEQFSLDKFMMYCERFELPLKRKLQKLSKGMLMRFQIAFALAREAKLYLFDEPSSGLDPIFRSEFEDIMYDIMEAGDKSILFSTHMVEELEKIADYLMYIRDGKCEFYLDKETLLSGYTLVKGTSTQIQYLNKEMLVGTRIRENSAEALLHIAPENIVLPVTKERPTLTDVIYYQYQKEEKV